MFFLDRLEKVKKKVGMSETVSYLLTVVRYIHQNSVKAGMVDLVDEWKWSSCMGYYKQEVYPKYLLDCNYILHLFFFGPYRCIRKIQRIQQRSQS